MFARLKRWFIGFASDIGYWLGKLDKCEICCEELADSICVGCNRRICCGCNSGYYEDAELCCDCRAKITPEEEEQDRKESAETLAEQCTCGKSNSPCDLSDEEHRFIERYKPYEVN